MGDLPLAEVLRQLKALRSLPSSESLQSLQRWQSQRLLNTHQDLAASDRYRPAINFFQQELYGDKDLSQRDHDAERAYPLLQKALPNHIMNILKQALELDLLSLTLDHRLDRQLQSHYGQDYILNDERYVVAYRHCDNFDQRRQQIDYISLLGHGLDRAVAKPWLYGLLRLSRGPAHMAGLHALQHFIEEGFRAFRHMKGADYFVKTIVERELTILHNIQQGQSNPLALSPTPS